MKMSKLKLISIVIFVCLLVLTVELIASSKPHKNDNQYELLKEYRFTQEEMNFIINYQIDPEKIKPYLQFETFRVYNFFFYENIRTKYQLSYLETINTYNFPNYYNYDTIPTLAIFTNTPLVLVNKHFFLLKSYYPKNLVNVNTRNITYIKRPNEEMYLQKEALENFDKLYQEAKNEGFELVIFSGFRPYHKQQELYYETFGMDNSISAKPGHSEHQTGLAIDVSTLKHGLTDYFSLSQEYLWLEKNAHRFGYILRYPKDKEHITGYQFEPWHFRYVGVEHAKIIYEQNLTLEEYLFKTFELK